MDRSKVTVSDLAHDESFTSAEAAEVFKTEYDESIELILKMLRETGFTEEEFSDVVDAAAEVMETHVPIPTDMTIEESMPLVEMSDMLVLGLLAHELAQRADAAVAAMHKGDPEGVLLHDGTVDPSIVDEVRSQGFTVIDVPTQGENPS
jgi:hypothetical protein